MTDAPNHAPVDATAIDRFVEMTFGYLDGFVPIRRLAETGTPHKAPHQQFCRCESLAATLAKLATTAAKEQRGLYVVPGTVAKPGSAKSREIVQTGVLVVDLDTGDIEKARDHLTRHIGEPSMVVSSGGRTVEGADKLHLYWRLTEAAVDADLERVRALRQLIAEKAAGDLAFKSLHQPIRVPGTIHGKNGRTRTARILSNTSLEYDLSEIEEAVRAMPALIETGSPRRAEPVATKDTFSNPHTRIRAGGVDGITRFEALSSTIGRCVRGVRLGHSTEADAWTEVRSYNSTHIDPPWDEPRLRREFDAIRKRDCENHGAGASQPLLPDRPIPPLSDDKLAAQFIDRHGGDWRYVPTWRTWLRWTGQKWERDETGAVNDLVRLACRDASFQAANNQEAKRIASHKTISAVVRIARTDPTVARRSEDWDMHPMLLNTPDGVVDLETGEIMRRARELHLTQITSATPGRKCPQWLRFLDEVTDHDADLQAYLKRLSGYALTGLTTEQVFVFLNGTGANGKSVFTSVLREVLGNYAATATADTFMATRGTQHLSSLAGLRAARLVLVNETEAGRAWAEARIKAVTGGERIRANFMRQDFFEFSPQFKLLVAGNHRPDLSGVGEAMRRRLQVVPFEVTVPPERRDKDLVQKLLRERDGILGWMIEGCHDWQAKGLLPPTAIQSASEEYFRDEDLIGQWIAECCLVGATEKTTSRNLYANWAAWADSAGIDRGSQTSFGKALKERGFKDCKVNRARGWSGICIRTSGPKREAAE